MRCWGWGEAEEEEEEGLLIRDRRPDLGDTRDKGTQREESAERERRIQWRE